jgi:metallo-beta-lactamase family protein
VNITFLGAAETVTGSCYLVNTGKTKFLVDCGMFQGPDVELRNYDEFAFDPKEIDFLILTHSHIDHSGLLPKLYRKGFRGDVYLSVPTSHVSELLLLDAAGIQENKEKIEEYKRRKYFHLPSVTEKMLPVLYDTSDAYGMIALFKTVELNDDFKVNEEVTIQMINAGHILGAVSVIVKVDGKSILFSGDIGHKGQDLVEHFDVNLKVKVDYVVMESLYGGQIHEPRENTEKALIDTINSTIQRNGNVMIPSFAVQRTQELIYIFKRAKQERRLHEDVQIFLDSPLAIRVTKAYTSNAGYLKEEIQQMIRSGDSPFYVPKLKFTQNSKQSFGIMKKGPSVILAGSGMADGGRILGHLRTGLEDTRNTVVFVGYQAEQTLGRELADGAKKVTIDTKVVRVKASIEKLMGFSAHADNNDLLDFVNRLDRSTLKKIFLVHADPSRSEAFAAELKEKGIDPVIPTWKETIEL